MGDTTEIAWTDSTFNPWIGCSKVSPGCANCYAEKSPAALFRGIKWGPGSPRVRTSAANWKKPLGWNRAAEKAGERRRVFCASLADVFDPEVPRTWRGDLFKLIEDTPCLSWLLLTKRPEHFNDMAVSFGWPQNVWLGVTVENQEQAEKRIPLLLAQKAAVRFLSCEPLLGPLTLFEDREGLLRGPAVVVHGGMTASTPSEAPEGYDDSCSGIDWVIVGGESGPKARPFDLAWARSLRDQCHAAQVPYFFKQLGARPQGENGPFLGAIDSHGADPLGHPADLRIRDFPTPTPRSTT